MRRVASRILHMVCLQISGSHQEGHDITATWRCLWSCGSAWLRVALIVFYSPWARVYRIALNSLGGARSTP